MNNAETYERQMGYVRPPSAVAVVGAGGVGAWTALQLAQAGTTKLVLIDDDHVEEHNRNRLPVPPDEVGESKVDAVSRAIQRLRPDIEVITLNMQADADLIEMVRDYHAIAALVDTTDATRVQSELERGSREVGIDYVRAGCGIESASVFDHVAAWGEDMTGYEVVPSWVSTACVAGALATAALCGCPMEIHAQHPMATHEAQPA